MQIKGNRRSKLWRSMTLDMERQRNGPEDSATFVGDAPQRIIIACENQKCVSHFVDHSAAYQHAENLSFT